MPLPDDLRAALEGELERTPPKNLIRAASDLSKRYRAGHGRSSAPFVHSSLDAAAYAAYRLPATFAAICAVLREVRDRRPTLRPKTLLDVGAGPGTAAWAAAEVWPELEQITALERDQPMIELGAQLAGQARSRVIRNVVWRRVDLTGAWDGPMADVVIAAYLLGELPATAHDELVGRLWSCAADACVIVEPGTPRGFALVRQATDRLTALGGHALAPYPPDWPCLLTADDWCHFAQRVPRTRVHRSAKEATLSYEDEKYSYVAVSRTQGLPIAARVIRQPQVRSGHVRLVLCTARGVERVVVTRSNREAYRRARDLAWGSAIAPEEASLYGLTVTEMSASEECL